MMNSLQRLLNIPEVMGAVIGACLAFFFGIITLWIQGQVDIITTLIVAGILALFVILIVLYIRLGLKTLIWAGLVTLIIALPARYVLNSSFGTPPVADIPLPLNAQMVKDAWDAFNAGDYVTAASRADECSEKFKDQGGKEQENFTRNGLPSPPTGAVDDATKKDIFARDLLNTVGTCYFIKGQAMEKLGNVPDAKVAYTEVVKFPDARAWDPGGFFWSPAEAASTRLQSL
jgi:hypothetical protein